MNQPNISGPQGPGQPPSSNGARRPRTAFLLGLDILMFLLVCVLEPLSLTGLTWHEWLGFALCPLVLLHVVLQWQWFVTQFRRFLTPGAYRTRVNSLLNILLFIMMAAVLISGVLVSKQAVLLVGEPFGRARVWSEVHGWLNFILVVLVGLHLALNWDWIVAAVRRRPRKLRVSVGAPAPGAPPTFARYPGFANALWRGAAVLVISALAAGVVYISLATTLRHKIKRMEASVHYQQERNTARQATGTPQKPPLRQDRPADFSDGLQKLGVTLGVILFTVLVGRALRLRL